MIGSDKALRFTDEDNRIKELLNRCWDDKKIVLYGAGYCGYETINLFKNAGINIFAVCDDNRVGEIIEGIHISKIEDIHPSKKLIIFITSGFNHNMKAKLEKLGLIEYYYDIDFGRYDAEKECFEYYSNNMSEVVRAYDLLKDDKSRRLLIGLINYRISRNTSYIEGMEEDTPQYYPDYPDLRREDHVFVDLGAYDGDSVKGFIDYVNDKYDSIVAVEASKTNYDRLVSNTRGIKNIECVNIGVSDCRNRLGFYSTDAKNSFFSDDTDNMIEVDSIDSILCGKKVSFIKMDIEGAETDAIKGGVETIRKNIPILAISVYHYVEDLFKIQLLIEELCPNKYDYYLRHYSPTVIETILYAVPKAI